MKTTHLAILRTLFRPHQPGRTQGSSLNSPYTVRLVTLSARLEQAAESRIGLKKKKDLLSLRLRHCGLWKNKTLWWRLWRVSTSRSQLPVGRHLVCPAQVGGGADLPFSLMLCFFLPGGIFSWLGCDMAEAQLNNHSSDRGGCASLHPSIQGFRKSCLKGGNGGGGGGLVAWWGCFHRKMIYVEKDQKRGFWLSSGFHAEWLHLSAGLCFCHHFFKLLVFVISSSIRSFSSELLFLYSCSRQHWGFQSGSSCCGLVHGHQISFTQFCWQLTLNCQQLLFSSSTTTSQ